MTDLSLSFDGSNLRLSDETGERLNVPAVSGKIGFMDPRHQAYVDHGPIPEGQYSFSVGDIQTLNARNSLLSSFGMGAWPAYGGAEVGWGLVRAPLTTEDGTITFGRGGFFIHGGRYPGSQGCIDVLFNDLPLFAYIQALDDSDGIIHVTVDYPDYPKGPSCFPAHTRIQTSLTTSTAISALRVGDIVLAYDSRVDMGRGALVPRRVTRLYRNTTTEWIRLRWFDGEARELITTPGHHFLDQFGQFPTIAAMTRNGSTTVVLASGDLAEVTAERIVYSAETAHRFERATVQGMVMGNAALQPVEADAWQTYNFEVEDLHTYVAGGC